DPSLERIAEGTSLSPSLVEMILVCLKQKQPHDPIERHLRERIAALSLYAPPPGSLPEGKTTWREIHRELIKKEVEYLHYYQEIRKQYTTHSSADRAE
ncbi:MAG: hypothetical protein J2P36_25355, partial [Ktedonobacteraceae bacterium]|nr:hypothetical protein [Ktedonobacteraceae bacterium]